MRIRSTLLAATAAVLLLALGTGTAAASRSFSVVGGGQAILAIATALTFRDPATGVNIINRVTMHGSIHSLIAKTVGSLAGVITSVLTGDETVCRDSLGVTCSTLPQELPWHIQLLAFTGTLPEITSITILLVEAAFLLRLGGRPLPGLEGTECLYKGRAGGIGRTVADPAGRRIETLEADERKPLPLIRILNEEFFRRCPREGVFRGIFTLAPLIIIRLH